MSEFEDILLRDEFAVFRAAYAPAVQPVGPAAVRETVRLRRRRAAVVTAAAVVLAVAIPVAASAALQRPGPPPGPVGTPDPAPSVTAGSPAPSPTPSAAPSTASPTAGAPDGRISRAQLLAARLDLPIWPSYVPKTCTTDNVRLRAEPGDRPGLLGELRHGDVDGDGATETVALIGCQAGEAQVKQVVAFDRNAAGRITTMGQIAGTYDELGDITEFSVQASGKIRVRVADIQPCCGVPEWAPQRQWRTYGWTRDRFAQIAGPTRFGVDPRLTDLTLTAGDLVLGPPDNVGRRPGTVTVTVVNKGPVDVPRLGFTGFSSVGKSSGGDVTRCRAVRSDGPETCLLDGLPAGQRRTYTFQFLVGPVPMGGPPALRVIHYDSQERYWRDLNPEDNLVRLQTNG